jgi:hypothetical protein
VICNERRGRYGDTDGAGHVGVEGTFGGSETSTDPLGVQRTVSFFSFELSEVIDHEPELRFIPSLHMILVFCLPWLGIGQTYFGDEDHWKFHLMVQEKRRGCTRPRTYGPVWDFSTPCALHYKRAYRFGQYIFRDPRLSIA